MRKTTSWMQRLLALALAFIMVMGYVPVFASAEGENEPVTLLTATVTREQTGGGEEIEATTEEGEPAPTEYIYTAVLEGITEGVTVIWKDGTTGNPSASTSGEMLPATISYEDMSLTVAEMNTPTYLTVAAPTWASVTAASAITVPDLVVSGGTIPAYSWNVTYGDSNTPVPEDKIAHLSMGTLTATTEVAGRTFTAKTTITAVPVTVSEVTPAQGWYATLPETVTVTGTAANNAGIDDIDKKITINGNSDDYQWNGNNGSYTCSFAPVDGENTIGGNPYKWGVDNVDPEINITSAYVNAEGKTVVNYTYTLGPSGGTITINGQAIPVNGQVTNESGTVTLSSEQENGVAAKIQNNLVAPKSAEDSKPVVPYPSLSYTGEISRKDGVTYVTNEDTLTFTVADADGAVAWYVNGTLVTGETGNTLTIYTKNYENGKDITVKAVDERNRDVTLTATKVTVDAEAPNITITAPSDETDGFKVETYFNADRKYTIAITDNAGLDNCSANAYINGSEVPVMLTNGSGTVTVENGQTLTAINVTAKDQNANEATSTYTTNVHVDTIKPVIDSASIAISYYDETTKQTQAGSISSLYNQGDKIYLVLDTGANNKDDDGKRPVTITATYHLVEANPDAATAETWGNDMTITRTWTVAKDEVTPIELKVSAKDLAGNVPEADSINLGQNITLDGNNGTYSKTVIVDRRTPEDITENPLTTAPVVTLAVDAANSCTHEGTRYFKGTFDFNMNIKDSGSGLKDEEDPIQKANIQVTASGASVTLNTPDVRPDDNGNAKVSMTIKEGQEATDGNINLKIYDNVGNYYYYNEKFAVDSLAPRVSVAVTSEYTAKTTVGGVDFYQKPVTLTFTLTDQLPCTATINYSIDGVAQEALTLTNSGAIAEITVAAGTSLTALSVSAEDALENTTTAFSGYTFSNAIEVDSTPAVATVSITSEDGEPVTADGVSYYDKPVTVKVSVSDENITDGNGTAKLTYAIDDVNQEIDLLKQEGNTYTISVENNKVLTALKVKVVDDAGNVTETLTGVASSNAEGEVSYTGNALAVDQTAPVVSVVKTLNEAEHVQTTDKGVAYYKDGTVTYTVTITDAFLNEDASSIKFNGAGNATFTAGTGTLSAADTMTLEFTVNDDVALETIAITSLDMIGLTAAEVAVTDPLTEDDLTFGQTENTHNYTGPKVVSDTKAPTTTVVLTGNIETLVEKNGVYYVKVKAPAKGLDGIFTGAAKETVELTLTVKDKNLTLDETAEKTFISSNTSKKWTLDGETATYTDAVEVGLHNTAYFKIDVAAYDLVGHPMKLETIRLGETEGNEITIEAEGEWKATISLDRRTPSTEDGEVPEISLTDNASKKFETLGGLDLYATDFNFTLNVKDDKGEEEDEKHAGLKSVEWTLADGVTTVTADDNKTSFNDYTSSHSESIAVAGKGETDSAVLTIVAEDNVDNTIQYGKNFAFDNLAPRVTVTFDGESVRDNEYFNKTRTATVVVEDLHMPALADFDKYVKINTKGTASGWKQEGIKYINTFTFADDGEYTFSMSAKDLAGNETADAEVTYVGEHPQKFVIDKTNPVLRVTFAQTPSGRDPQGVLYYAQNVTATATITELNFAAADVVARFNNTNVGLGTWSNDLDHRASVTFGQGNRYSFDITFQDLAGNHAEAYRSPVFSVDTTDPTVVISGGNLKAGQLNIVPGDLTLALTVNDAQQNLSDYTVTLTHLDNNFKKTTVSGAEYYTVTTQQERTTVVINFSKIAKEKKFDGLYTVDVSARDYAGNQVNLTPDVTFSLNRFGSTFTTDDEFTLNFLATGSDGNAYHDGIDKKLIIQEINPNEVWNDDTKKDAGSSITVVVNGTSTKLQEGKHYKQTVSREGNGDNKWYVYTYEIDPKAFESEGTLVDGRYAILLYGVDGAGNKNTNEANESGKLQKNADGDYTGKIEFILDSTAPIITTTGIESRKNYNAEAQQLKIFLSDNTPAGIRVYLNGEEIALTDDALAELGAWLVYDEEAGCYTLNVPEQNTLFAGQDIRIVVVDAAGNEAEFEIADFSVSTNFFVRMLNSTWFLVSIIVLLLLAAMFVFLTLKKRKQEFTEV